MSRNSVLIPEAKKAMDSFKSEVANSLNVIKLVEKEKENLFMNI